METNQQEFISRLVLDYYRQATACLNNSHNHNEDTRTHWQQEQLKAAAVLQAMQVDAHGC
jgi:hypothetical protein